MRTDVEFPGHHGVTLRGWLYQAAGAAGRAPAVVMAHGFSATRRMGLPPYAEVFSAAGFAVLLYDHRGFGDSDGEPRQEINPWAQARDYRYALDWLSRQPGVDPNRLGLWGSSFSAGEAMVVAAIDRRVKVVIANVPFAGLSADIERAGLAERFDALKAALEDDTGAGPADIVEPVIGPMAVARLADVPSDAPVFLDQPESAAWFGEMGGTGSGWRNTFTLRGLGGTSGFDPSVAAPFISPRPLLMVVATEDRVAPTEVARATYEIAGEPKQIEFIAGGHFVPYSGAAFEQAASVMREFLLAQL